MSSGFFKNRGSQDIINLDAEEFNANALKKLTWADFINYTVMLFLKSNEVNAMEQAVDKLEILMINDLPDSYEEELNAVKNDSRYLWLKFKILLKYVKKRIPEEVDGKL